MPKAAAATENGTAKSAASRIEEIEARRAARRGQHADERQVQLCFDLEALDELEVAHGDDAVVRIDLDRYLPGLPTMVLARLPKPTEFKRYQDTVKGRGQREGDPIEASNILALACVLYPEKEVYERVREAFPPLHMNLANTILKAAQGRAAEEGKG